MPFPSTSDTDESIADRTRVTESFWRFVRIFEAKKATRRYVERDAEIVRLRDYEQLSWGEIVRKAGIKPQ